MLRRCAAIIKKTGYESVEDLPRTAVSFRSSAYQELAPVLRLTETSNSAHRIRLRVPNQAGIDCRTQGQLQEYLNLVDWRGLELSSTGKMCKTSVKRFECSVAVWAAWIKLTETLLECRRTRDEEEWDETMSKAAKQKRMLVWEQVLHSDFIRRDQSL